MTGTEGTEWQYLSRCYEKAGSQLIILYGQTHTGMEDMARSFCQGKAALCYRARACSEREQLFLWRNELCGQEAKSDVFLSFFDLFQALCLKGKEKKVIIIEEFHHIMKQSRDFMPALVRFLHRQEETGGVMAILCTRSVGWVESALAGKLGAEAREITAFLKIKERSFFDMARRFPTGERKRQIEFYGVLGGFPGLWNHFEAEFSAKENICRHILDRNSFLHEEALRLVSQELREPGIYATILAALARGRNKLNELYLHTGFSRAKISVYLKNLMELELVEKVFSFDTAGRENARKGVYRIRHSFVFFYFRYLYPHLTHLAGMAAADFYDTYIAPDFRRFITPAFIRICREYMGYLNRQGKLPFVCTRIGEWAGKAGDIDIVARDEAGHTIIGLCSWEEPVMSYEEYEWLLFCARKAQLNADYIYLFSAERFDPLLLREAEEKDSLRLTDLHSF